MPHVKAVLSLVLLIHVVNSVSSNFCTTPGCRKASSEVLSFIDPSIDPCDNFYKFTCGSLFKKTYETKPVSLEALVTKEVDEQTTLMLLKPIEFAEPKGIQGLKKFFRTCMDDVTIEKEGTSALKKVLEQLGGWPVLDGSHWNGDDFSADRLLIKLRRMGYEFRQLFYFGTTAGQEEPNFLVSEAVVQNLEDKDKEAYHDFVVQVAVLMGADQQEAHNELQEMLLFKIKLLRIVEIAGGQLNRTTIKDVQGRFPLFNWMRFINNMIFPNKKLSEFDELYTPSTEYLTYLANLMKETTNRTIANYIIWKAVEAAIPYLPIRFKELRQKFIQASSNPDDDKDEEIKNRLVFCKDEAKKALPPAFEALYIREYFTPEKRQKAQELADLVRLELNNLLNTTDLYDEETREKMLDKANAIFYVVGGPDKLFDAKLLYEVFDEKENINTDTFLTIVSILKRQKENFRFKLSNGVSPYYYYEETAIVNAFYDPFRNAFDLPAAILQGLYFNEKRPQYLNYGTIGTMAGIELVRGFTQEGSKFTKDGSLNNLWSNTVRKNFNKKASCLIREAYGFPIEDSVVRMDGKRTLDKNICDYTGVAIAYRAYNTWMKTHGEEKQLPGLSYTPKQLFWISAASYFCDTIPAYKLKDFVEGQRHGHPTFRSFGSLSNNKHFGEDFNCATGVRMNPSHKCQVFL